MRTQGRAKTNNQIPCAQCRTFADCDQGPSEFRVVRYVDPVPDFLVFRRRSGPDPGVIISNMRIKIRIIWRFEVVETKTCQNASLPGVAKAEITEINAI